uniref:Uncharacterized protein n=1 Tax=viral metagenome TaxID=1070528 RepID=A0A6M3MEX4_9ZZZZ
MITKTTKREDEKMEKRKFQIVIEVEVELEDYEGEGLIETEIKSALDDSPFWNPQSVTVSEI